MGIVYVPPRKNKASNIKIDDANNNFQSNDVEGALKELAENGGSGSGHTHSNKSTLDGITYEKVTSWDNKLDSIPSNYVTESDLTSYQQKTDDALTTTSKNIVGAINENGSQINKIVQLTDTEFKQKIVTDILDEFTGGKKQVYLTQAEYDALIEEEKNDETKVYNITDSQDNGGITPEQSTQLTTAYEHTKSSHFSGDYNDLDNLPNIAIWDGVLTSPNGNKFTIKISDEGIISADRIIEYGNIILSTESLSVDEDKSVTFTVKLDKAPTNNQIINLNIDNGNCTVDKASLTFTPVNYNTEQTVTISGVNDINSIEDKSSTIILSSDNIGSKTINIIIKDINDTSYVKDNLILDIDTKKTFGSAIKDTSGRNNSITYNIDSNEIDTNPIYKTSDGHLNLCGHAKLECNITGLNPNNIAIECYLDLTNLSQSLEDIVLIQGEPASFKIYRDLTNTNENDYNFVYAFDNKLTYNMSGKCHIIFNVDSEYVSFYLNNVLVEKYRVMYNTIDYSVYSKFVFNGYNCDNLGVNLFRIYNKLLSDEEISQNYNSIK